MSDERIERLELEVAELRKQLDSATRRARGVSEVTPEEIDAYRKVRDMIASDVGEFWGISDCFLPGTIYKPCLVTYCVLCGCRAASWGPCGSGGGSSGGTSRFDELGG